MADHLTDLINWLISVISPYVKLVNPWIAPVQSGIVLLSLMGIKIASRKSHGSDKIAPRKFGPREIISGGAKIGGGIATAVGLFSILAQAEDPEQATDGEGEVTELPKRSLGDIPFEASILGSGGIYVANGAESEGIAILDACLEMGINYFDTATQYGQGESERRHGLWLQRLESEGRRADVFLATKTLSRSFGEAQVEIENSYARLRTDYVDLLQLHAINNMDIWRQISGPNGALKAVEEAKASGRVKHIGISNHADPDALLTILDEYPFESVLIPLGITDKIHKPFVEEVVPYCIARGISVVAMKVFAAGKLNQTDVSLEKCLHYTLTLPMSTAIIGMSSVAQVAENVAWTKTWIPMTNDKSSELAESVRGQLDLNSLWWKG